MSEKNSVVAIFNIHTEAEAAVKELTAGDDLHPTSAPRSACLAARRPRAPDGNLHDGRHDLAASPWPREYFAAVPLLCRFGAGKALHGPGHS